MLFKVFKGGNALLSVETEIASDMLGSESCFDCNIAAAQASPSRSLINSLTMFSSIPRT